MAERENLEFVGYEEICGYTVAKFRYRYGGYYEQTSRGCEYRTSLVMNKASCEERLRNLLQGKHPCEQISLVLQFWPNEPDKV